MSGDVLVNADTGEKIADCTPDEARELTDRIATAIGVTWELVVRAYRGRAWAALGYPTWDAYTVAEFGKYRLRLPSEERQETVASLREAGLSIRAIAAATGAAKSTVEADLARAGVPNRDTSDRPSVDPAPSSAERPDGEQGADPEARTPSGSAPSNIEGDDVDVMERLHQAAAEDKKIQGTDGKSYPDKSRAAVADRIGKAKAMAKEGYTSRQIAAAIGITPANFADFRKRHGIDEPPADSVVGTRTRKLDSDRIASEVASSLEGLVMSLELVNLADLDPEQIADWATSIRASLTALTRFHKQLKEMTQ